MLQVSLILYNEAAAAPRSYRRSGAASARAFLDVLERAGVKATIRASFGNDIDAACGQLFAQYEPCGGDR